jgi:hypothetical protein
METHSSEHEIYLTVQVEDEFTSCRVMATVFAALVQQAEEIRQPESVRIKARIDGCRIDVAERLDRRMASGRMDGKRPCVVDPLDVSSL